MGINLSGDSISVQLPYADWVKQFCQGIPGRRWFSARKEWHVPATPAIAAHLVAWLPAQCHENIVNLAHRGAWAIQVASGACPANRLQYAKVKPWDHQLKGCTLIERQAATMLAFDMGTGKSKCIVDSVVNLPCLRTLIICPKAMVQVWPQEFAKHAARPVKVVPLYAGTIAKRAQAMRDVVMAANSCIKEAIPLVIVVNYEAVIYPPLGGELLENPWDLVVCDESHKIKAPKGAISKYIGLELGPHADRRVCLTGTPMSHSPLDVFGQYRFLDVGIFGSSFTAFQARYAVMGGYGNHEVLGYQNETELRLKFFSIAMQVKKSDVLDLPPVVHTRRIVELEPEGRKIYTSMERELICQVQDGTVTAANALAKLLRLQQITSGHCTTQDGRVIRLAKQPKADALRDLFEEIPADEPIVVFCRFTDDIAQVAGATGNTGRGYYELSGHRNTLAEWQQSDKGDVLAVQIQAGGVGVSFVRSKYCIFYSLGFSLGDYEQALARLDRPGQERSTTYTHLIAAGTVDERVYDALANKRDVIDYVLEGVTTNGRT